VFGREFVLGGSCLTELPPVLIRPHGATWRSGYAALCKSAHPGSIPGVASINIIRGLQQVSEKRLEYPAARRIAVPGPVGNFQQVACQPSGNGSRGQAKTLSLAGSGA
jgi:hypothetical protein